MSRTSFEIFCIEHYAAHAGMSGPMAYRLFERSGLLKFIASDYEDLHGLGWEALMPVFDKYLGVLK